MAIIESMMVVILMMIFAIGLINLLGILSFTYTWAIDKIMIMLKMQWYMSKYFINRKEIDNYVKQKYKKKQKISTRPDTYDILGYPEHKRPDKRRE